MKNESSTSTYSKYAVRKSEAFYPWLLFLVWPFLSAVSAFRNYRQPWAKNVFWAFCAFYGLTFAIGAETEGMDIMAYIGGFQEMHGRTMSFDEVVAYFRSSGEIDILRTSISYVLSRFTGSQAVLTMTYGIVFGFFLSRNLWFLLDRLEGRLTLLTIMLATCFFLINPIWNINGFRMWTAAHIFLYGILPWLCDKNPKRLWVSVLSIMVHFSFIVPVGMAIGYMLLGNRLNFYFAAYIITFFISEINITAINNLMEAYAPEILQERTIHYRTEGALERQGLEEDNRNWYVRWHRKALTWSITGFMVVLFWMGRDYFKKNRGIMNLVCFTLLFYAGANVLSLLPSGGRFLTIGHLCAVALITLYVQNREKDKWLRRFVFISTPALLLYIIVAIRTSLYSVSAASVLGNPIIAFFITGENLSLNDVMRMLL